MTELIFEVTQEGDGGFCAECLTEGIVTQGDSWEALRANVRDAVKAYYFDRLGTLNGILRLVANHQGIKREDILKTL